MAFSRMVIHIGHHGLFLAELSSTIGRPYVRLAVLSASEKLLPGSLRVGDAKKVCARAVVAVTVMVRAEL